MRVAYIRTVKTASRATAVQIVHSNRRGSREIEHIGSAHTPEEVEVLKAVARQRLHASQDTFDFGDGRPAVRGCRSCRLGPSCCGTCWASPTPAWGLMLACGQDEVFKALVLARVIEPTSKLDTIRVLDRDRDRRAALSDDQAAAARSMRHR